MEGEITMANYKSMYKKMFNAVTDAINILQAAQVETEKMYIDADPANITPIRPGIEENGD